MPQKHVGEFFKRPERAASAFYLPVLWHEKDKGLRVSPLLLTPVAAWKQGGFYRGQIGRVHRHQCTEIRNSSEPLSLQVGPKTFGFQNTQTYLAIDSWDQQLLCWIRNTCECILKSYSVLGQNSIFSSVLWKHLFFFHLICQTHGMVGNLLF